MAMTIEINADIQQGTMKDGKECVVLIVETILIYQTILLHLWTDRSI